MYRIVCKYLKGGVVTIKHKIKILLPIIVSIILFTFILITILNINSTNKKSSDNLTISIPDNNENFYKQKNVQNITIEENDESQSNQNISIQQAQIIVKESFENIEVIDSEYRESSDLHYYIVQTLSDDKTIYIYIDSTTGEIIHTSSN